MWGIETGRSLLPFLLNRSARACPSPYLGLNQDLQDYRIFKIMGFYPAETFL